ncbi:PDZ and LIM domain protein 7-like isoform X5 [Tubulanus polymorphus]|uniref:PDZ and LIM domain protein 7-like isoform X5 n=1 Tax=Tubulanus polymorphus TaxID=672921 RepID=UPI003DA487B6
MSAGMQISAKLDRTDSSTPWGFRLQGGKDFSRPLTIQRVTPGSLADKCGLKAGDVVAKISGVDTTSVFHKEAQQAVINSGNYLELVLQRGGASSYYAPDSYSYPTFSEAAQPSPYSSQAYNNPASNYSSSPASGIGSQMSNLSLNRSPQPFRSYEDTSPEPIKVNVNVEVVAPSSDEGATVPVVVQTSQYNSPIGLYSADNTTQSLEKSKIDNRKSPTFEQNSIKKKSPPTEAPPPVPEIPPPVPPPPSNMTNGKPGVVVSSETLKLIKQEDEGVDDKQDVTTHSRTFRLLQQQLDSGTYNPQGNPPWHKSLNEPGRDYNQMHVGPGGGGYHGAPTHAPPPLPQAPAPKWSPASSAPPARGPAAPGGTRGNPRFGKKGDAALRTDSATRIPVCHGCSAPIRGPFVLALGQSWCPDHFTCANCNVKLIDIGFIEIDGRLYCERDYEQYFAPHCTKCKQTIVGDCVNALSQTWHPHCFLCTHCRQPIGSGGFHMEEGLPYCEKDWAEMFQMKCNGCQFPIEPGDRWVEAIGQNFHSECFNCSACQVNLEGSAFCAKNGKPYCKKHASGRF